MIGLVRRSFFVRGDELRGRVAAFGACCFLIATIVRGGNEEWGWMVLMAIPVLPLGWIAWLLLDT